ncbi:MAG: mechanosensitive ion channel protein [Nitrospinaceae bacterium]|nr:MAG: mechanosensitive ion channel protein [Nitrospinaceae bacterium]
MNLFESLDLETLTNTYVIPWGINIALALMVFIVGRMVAGILVSLVEKLLAKAKMEQILINFISSIVSAALLIFVIAAALDKLGVDTTSIIALLGAAGLAVGLALQSSLQNFAAGVMLIVFRPFKAGDYVDAGGTAGTVETIKIFSTVLKTPDNREVIVPNGGIYGGTITNFSARATRRIDMVFGIGYDDDIRRARDVIKGILESDDRVLKDPEPLIAVGELGTNSVNFNVRPWVNSGDYWPVKFALNERIKLAFDESGISIPYPQMDVHMDK